MSFWHDRERARKIQMKACQALTSTFALSGPGFLFKSFIFSQAFIFVWKQEILKPADVDLKLQVSQLYNKTLENYEESKNSGNLEQLLQTKGGFSYRSKFQLICWKTSAEEWCWVHWTLQNMFLQLRFQHFPIAFGDSLSVPGVSVLRNSGHQQDIEIHGCAIYPTEMVWPLAPRLSASCILF